MGLARSTEAEHVVEGETGTGGSARALSDPAWTPRRSTRLAVGQDSLERRCLAHLPQKDTPHIRVPTERGFRVTPRSTAAPTAAVATSGICKGRREAIESSVR